MRSYGVELAGNKPRIFVLAFGLFFFLPPWGVFSRWCLTRALISTNKAGITAFDVRIIAIRLVDEWTCTSNTSWSKRFLFYLFLFFPIPVSIFALLFSLPPSRNSDPGSHRRLFIPRYPLRFVPYIFIAIIFQLFLPSSTRVELCLPTLGALSN